MRRRRMPSFLIPHSSFFHKPRRAGNTRVGNGIKYATAGLLWSQPPRAGNTRVGSMQLPLVLKLALCHNPSALGTPVWEMLPASSIA